MRDKGWIKGLSVTLLISIVLGLAPAAVWAETADRLGDALAEGGEAITELMETLNEEPEEPWSDNPDMTETPQYYSFTGEQVLEERPNMGEERGRRLFGNARYTANFLCSQ